MAARGQKGDFSVEKAPFLAYKQFLRICAQDQNSKILCIRCRKMPFQLKSDIFATIWAILEHFVLWNVH
jgi:hypothetical protein